jgi:hypothetical protein
VLSVCAGHCTKTACILTLITLALINYHTNYVYQKQIEDRPRPFGGHEREFYVDAIDGETKDNPEGYSGGIVRAAGGYAQLVRCYCYTYCLMLCYVIGVTLCYSHRSIAAL